MAPKYDGVEPNVPVQRLTWNGSHPRPSTAIRPSLAKAMAGSLLPDEFAWGEEVKPAGVAGEMRSVFEKSGLDGEAGDGAAMAWLTTTTLVATAANATVVPTLIRMVRSLLESM